MENKHKLTSVKYIQPADIRNLPPDDIIVVSRILLNNTRVRVNLASIQLCDKAMSELIRACQQINEVDENWHRPCFGVEMRVENVQIIFDEQLSDLPYNSFVKKYSHALS